MKVKRREGANSEFNKVGKKSLHANAELRDVWRSIRYLRAYRGSEYVRVPCTPLSSTGFPFVSSNTCSGC